MQPYRDIAVLAGMQVLCFLFLAQFEPRFVVIHLYQSILYLAILIFILLLINRRDLMGDYVNTLTFNVIAWSSSIIMIILTFILVYTSIFQSSSAGLTGMLAHLTRLTKAIRL